MSAVNVAEILEAEALMASPPPLWPRWGDNNRCRECDAHLSEQDAPWCALAVLAEAEGEGRKVLSEETIERLARMPRSPWRVVADSLGQWRQRQLYYPLILTGRPGVYAILGLRGYPRPEQAEEALRGVLGGYREGWVGTHAGAYQVFAL